MPPPTSPDLTVRTQIWTHVQRTLRRHALPDSRFNTDFLHFTPDFRGSDAAVARLASLACYQSATTILVTPDNCLEGFRLRALRDGKTVVVGTYRLRRGFVVLDPARVGESRWEVASCLDGMERVGRKFGVAELMEGRMKVGLCVFGGLAFNREGVVVWEGSGLFEVQWALMNDIGLLTAETPVVAMAHGCQIVDEEELGVGKIVADRVGEVQCDFMVTPEKVFEIEDATKPRVRLNFDVVDQEAMDSIPPLQELRGIRMMEDIMKDGGFKEEKEKDKPRVPTAEEQMGIDMVERLMKGYKA